MNIVTRYGRGLLYGVLASLLLRTHAFASSGTEAASFLDIPVGAAPAALGSAYSALATDAYATVWNPGGLGFLDSDQVAAQHLAYLESVYYEYFSFVHPFTQSSQAVGLSIQYLGTGDIIGTDAAGNPTGNFSSHFASYNLSYGHALGDQLSLGATAKYIDASISNVNAGAVAGDVGALYRPMPNLDVAAVVSNFGTQLTFISDSENLPLAGHLGIAYRPARQWTLAAEGVYEETGLTSGHWGVEWHPLDMIALRAGYTTETTRQLDASAGVTAGIGLRVWGQEFAYAWLPYGDLGSVQYFSLLLKFNGSEGRKRNLIQYQSIKEHRVAVIREGSEDTEVPDDQQLMELFQAGEKDPVAEKP